jgi:chromosome segregation ATPase
LLTEEQIASMDVDQLREEFTKASADRSNLQERLKTRESELRESSSKIENLESEIEKQLEDWDLLEEKLGQADAEIRKLMSDAQRMEALKSKVAEFESVTSELDEVKASLEGKQKEIDTLKEQGIAPNNSGSADAGAQELQAKLADKDEEIATLRKELEELKDDGGEESEAKSGEESKAKSGSDFTSLNESLKKFSNEISSAKGELEEAKKRMNQN